MFLSHRITEHWNKATLENLIKNGIQESTYLEYKACAALLEEYEITDRYGNIRKKTKPTDSIKREISKDVSAFANADGGTIIYGIIEKGHKPAALDEGFDPNIISKEWLEQVINSNIERHIDEIVIHPIEIAENRYVYVIEIPKSPTAPHMAKDHRYYKRYNFQVLPAQNARP